MDHPHGNWPMTAAGNLKQAYTQGFVIPPPKNKDEIEKQKTIYIAVDSRDRNYTEYPNCNKYSVPLENDILDVESIQLVSYNIPAPQFPVRKTNNALYLATLPPTIVHTTTHTPSGGPCNTITTSSTTFDVNYHENCCHEIRIQPGYYNNDPIVERLPVNDVTIDTFATEIQADQGGVPLLQDQLATQLEMSLNSDSIGGNSTYVVHVVSSSKYVFQTDFSNQCIIQNPDDCNVCSNPTFFYMFFKGPDEFYGSTTYEKVNISYDPCNPVYEEKTIGKTQPTYKKDSIGPIIGVPRSGMVTQLTGQVHIDNTNLTELHGVDTQFCKEVKTGDWLYISQISTPNAIRVKVTEVTSDTLCYINAASSTMELSLVWNGRYEVSWIRNLHPDPYIIMKMRECDTIQSYNDTIKKSFFLVPTEKNTFTEIHEYLPFKKFKPIRGRLDKLDISFYNEDGTLYDFMGKDHILLFKLVCFKQNISYGDF